MHIIQKETVKIIAGVKRLSASKPILKKLKIMPLPIFYIYIYVYNIYEIFSFVHKSSKSFLTKKFIRVYEKWN